MKSKDYWKNRAEQVASKQFKETDNYILGLRLEYEEALIRIRKDIESFYARFSQNNAITLDEARRQLNSRELEEFKMSLKEFTYKAKHNINGKWEKELNNVSYKVRLSRLQALQIQIRNQIEQLHQSQQQGVRRVLNTIYSDTYYRNIYEIQKGLGISVNFAKLDTKTIDKIVKEPWNGDNYSSRIWNNKEKLVMELQTNLTQAFIRGDKIDRTSKIIADRMGVARNRATILVNTESAYITSKATFDSYSGSGVVKQYEVLATLDLRTSEICRSIDGKVFNVSEKQIGVNAPPFHPNCRTTTVAYFESDIDEERIARDPMTGENKYVSGNMKYEEWYTENVSNNPKALDEEKKMQNKASDKQQYEKYKKVLGKEMSRSFDKFQDLKYNNVKEWELLKDYAKSRSTNMISVFNTFDDYKKYKNIIETEVVGLTTSNGIKITGQSKHFIERVFGTTQDPHTGRPRDGVKVDDIIDALLNGNVRIRKSDPNSIKFVTDKCMVSINPNTGNLIQVNP